MTSGHDDSMTGGLGNGYEKATCQHSAPGVAVRPRRDEQIIEASHHVGGPHARSRSRTLSPGADIDAQAMEKGGSIMLHFGCNKGLPAGTETAWGCRAIVDQGRHGQGGQFGADAVVGRGWAGSPSQMSRDGLLRREF